jgi:hypothetical protein
VVSEWSVSSPGVSGHQLIGPEKHPVTPGVPTPARELYGTMLLERGRYIGSHLDIRIHSAFRATLREACSN